MSDHNEILTRLLAIEENQKEMRAEFKPVIDLFETVKRMGKWTAVIVAFFGSLTALALGVKELFKK